MLGDLGHKELAASARRPVARTQYAAHVRVGIDLVAVVEVRQAIEQFGDRYVNRLFTEGEQAVCGTNLDRTAQGLAERFAAKEAAIKVLQPEGSVAYTDIEVISRADGGFSLALHGPMGVLARGAGLREPSLSMTHTARYAAATVIVIADTTVESCR